MNILQRFFHNIMGWHRQPHMIDHDGASWFGVCPVCQKRVLQDSQGNWFAARD